MDEGMKEARLLGRQRGGFVVKNLSSDVDESQPAKFVVMKFHRELMVEQIAAMLKKSRPNAPKIIALQVPALARRIEATLFRNSETREEYANRFTLEKRIKDIAMHSMSYRTKRQRQTPQNSSCDLVKNHSNHIKRALLDPEFEEDFSYKPGVVARVSIGGEMKMEFNFSNHNPAAVTVKDSFGLQPIIERDVAIEQRVKYKTQFDDGDSDDDNGGSDYDEDGDEDDDFSVDSYREDDEYDDEEDEDVDVVDDVLTTTMSTSNGSIVRAIEIDDDDMERQERHKMEVVGACSSIQNLYVQIELLLSLEARDSKVNDLMQAIDSFCSVYSTCATSKRKVAEALAHGVLQTIESIRVEQVEIFVDDAADDPPVVDVEDSNKYSDQSDVEPRNPITFLISFIEKKIATNNPDQGLLKMILALFVEPNLDQYTSALERRNISKCIDAFVQHGPSSIAALVCKYLLKRWPTVLAERQLLCLNQLESVFRLASGASIEELIVPVMRRINVACLHGNWYVANAAISFGDKVSRYSLSSEIHEPQIRQAIMLFHANLNEAALKQWHPVMRERAASVAFNLRACDGFKQLQ